MAGIPPDALMALLHGAGPGGPGGGPPPGGPSPGMGGPPPGMGGPPGLPPGLLGAGGPPRPPEPAERGNENQPIDILHQMIQLGQKYIQVEPDAEDKATMAKLLATLHQYLAKEQQDRESALGGQLNPRVLRKAAGPVGP